MRPAYIAISDKDECKPLISSKLWPNKNQTYEQKKYNLAKAVRDVDRFCNGTQSNSLSSFRQQGKGRGAGHQGPHQSSTT